MWVIINVKIIVESDIVFLLVQKENDAWKYYATHCEPGWNPHNRNCYKLQKEKKTWNEALQSCQSNNSVLTDITSLAEVEFLVTLLGDGECQVSLV